MSDPSALPLEKLVRLPVNSQNREALLSHVKDRILPSLTDKDTPVNQDMAFALTRHIIEPPLQWPLIPYLLKLLMQVEHIRKHSIKQAEGYLATLKTSAGTCFSQTSALNKEDLKKLQRICKQKSNDSMRKIFRTTVLGLCEMHVNRLWISQESYMLPKQMRTYFPSLHIDVEGRFQDRIWQNHYLFDSTAEEREEIHNEGLVCKAFLDKARKWESQWRAQQSQGDQEDGLYEKAFASKFPGPDEQTLLQNIRFFIERVEGSIATMLDLAKST